MKKTFLDLVAEAEAQINTISAEDAKALVHDDDVVMVDLRDIREVKREGKNA